MLQILKSFLENIGEGKLVLKKRKEKERFNLNVIDIGKEKILSLTREPQAYMHIPLKCASQIR